MQEQKKVELIKNDGTKTSIDLISIFQIKEKEKKYILLTANEVDQNGLIKILAAEITDGKLEKIVDQGEWTLVKNAMRSIISSSKENFEYINLGDMALSYVVSDNFARIIAVQESAKVQLIKDYEEKKPEPQAIEAPKEEQPQDPNNIIYPSVDGENSGNEISPGISEAGVDGVNSENNNEISNQFNSEIAKDVTEMSQADVSQEDVNNVSDSSAPIPSDVFNIEKNDITNEEEQSTTTNNELVSKVEAAPLKDIVEDYTKDSSVKTDYAREKLISAIENAVDEYISTVKLEKNDSLEINALKTNINAMQEELNKINKALNTQE